MSRTTCIRDADWVVSWNAAKQRHQYLRGADVAFTDDRIDYVGPRHTGAVDDEIDGAGLMVMPGLVNPLPSVQPADHARRARGARQPVALHERAV